MLRAVAEARAAQRRMRSLARLNLELATREAQQKATAIGVAGGLAIAAFVIVLYAIGLIFALVAIVLDLWLPLWASVLIVIGLMLLAAAILGLLARSSARKALPPRPLQAIEEGERTIATLKSHV
jgi:uncharacterized membrane protein